MSVLSIRRGHRWGGVIASATPVGLALLLVAMLFTGTASAATRGSKVPQKSSVAKGRVVRWDAVSRVTGGTVNGKITVYHVPTPVSAPIDIKVGPDGNLYFSEVLGNKIGEIDPTTHQITEYPLPQAACIPYAVNGGPGEDVWFTALGCNSIGKLDLATHKITLYPIPTLASYPSDIKRGPDGALWFTEFAAGKIGRFDPATDTFTEYSTGLLTGPQDIAVMDGGVWFSEQLANKIARIDPYTHAIQTYNYPTLLAQTLDLDPGKPNTHQVWFAEITGNKVGYINTQTRVIKEFNVPTPLAGPLTIGMGPDYAMYFNETLANQIGRIDLKTFQIQEFPVPNLGTSLGLPGRGQGVLGDITCTKAPNPQEQQDDPCLTNGSLWSADVAGDSLVNLQIKGVSS